MPTLELPYKEFQRLENLLRDFSNADGDDFWRQIAFYPADSLIVQTARHLGLDKRRTLTWQGDKAWLRPGMVPAYVVSPWTGREGRPEAHVWDDEGGTFGVIVYDREITHAAAFDHACLIRLNGFPSRDSVIAAAEHILGREEYGWLFVGEGEQVVASTPTPMFADLNQLQAWLGENGFNADIRENDIHVWQFILDRSWSEAGEEIACDYARMHLTDGGNVKGSFRGVHMNMDLSDKELLKKMLTALQHEKLIGKTVQNNMKLKMQHASNNAPPTGKIEMHATNKKMLSVHLTERNSGMIAKHVIPEKILTAIQPETPNGMH